MLNHQLKALQLQLETSHGQLNQLNRLLNMVAGFNSIDQMLPTLPLKFLKSKKRFLVVQTGIAQVQMQQYMEVFLWSRKNSKQHQFLISNQIPIKAVNHAPEQERSKIWNAYRSSSKKTKRSQKTKKLSLELHQPNEERRHVMRLKRESLSLVSLKRVSVFPHLL